MSDANAYRAGVPATPRDRETAWTRRFLGLLIALVFVRAAYALAFPLDLAPDESYYWDWGRRPDIGYFSKPPMIGWLMAVAGTLGGNSMFALKFFPAILTTAGLGFVFLLGRDLYGARAGFWAVAVLVATPANVALNTFFTIDAPLFLGWSASLWFAWRLFHGDGKSRLGWAVGLTSALGWGYLTKQIQLAFPVLLGVYVSLLPPEKRRSAVRGFLGVIVVSLVFLAPPLLWNWRHDWITFRHTADELADTPFAWQRSAKFVGEFLGGQAGLGGGISFVLMMTSAGATLWRWRRVGAPERFLLLFFLPGWIAYAALSVHQRVEQNWAMVFYTTAAVLLSGWVEAAPSPATGLTRRRWLIAGVGMGAGLALALMAIPFVFPASPWAGSRVDPTVRIRGWRVLAEQVQRYRMTAPRPDHTFLLAPDDRYVASALAFYLPDHPRTYCWENPKHPESQYGIWGRPIDRVGWDAFVILRDPDHVLLREIRGGFRQWERLGTIDIRLGVGGVSGERDRHYAVFRGLDWQPSDRESAGGPAR